MLDWGPGGVIPEGSGVALDVTSVMRDTFIHRSISRFLSSVSCGADLGRAVYACQRLRAP